jgi:hypothetical protein
MTSLSEEEAIKRTIKAMRSRRFDARFARSREIARDMVLELVPLGATIGIGDSSSLRQIEIVEELEARGHQIVNPFRSSVLPEEGNVHSIDSMLRQSLGRDIYITGANVVTMDGQLVSVDGAGNRVAGMIFGAPKVIVVLGQNKIVPDFEAALERIKKVIAPAHAKHRGFHTPCARTGECTDCRGKNRICAVVTIMESKPMMTELSVVLVGDDLGLGWDPDWPAERIEKIRKAHNEKAWRPAMDLKKL